MKKLIVGMVALVAGAIFAGRKLREQIPIEWPIEKTNNALLDGKFVNIADLDARRHKFIGMWRAPAAPYRSSDCDIMCPCGKLLRYVEEGFQHYQSGHFDLPQYKTI
jgi:hypothetical protein